MLKIQAEANVPTEYGTYRILAVSEDADDWMPHLAVIADGTDLQGTVNIRIHSECITGEVFHSLKCECGPQLDSALRYIQKNGGVVIYLRQEGRNIGIINKLKAYHLQEQGLNTAEANLALHLPVDGRKFDDAVAILNLLGIQKINLLTNNPEKISAIQQSNILLEKRIPLELAPGIDNEEYLRTKKNTFGHLLDRI